MLQESEKSWRQLLVFAVLISGKIGKPKDGSDGYCFHGRDVWKYNFVKKNCFPIPRSRMPLIPVKSGNFGGYDTGPVIHLQCV